MSRLFRYHFQWLFIIILVNSILLASCNHSTQTPTTPPTEYILQPTQTQTLTPTETPQPPLVVLLAPPSSDSTLVEQLQALVAELAAHSNLRFEVLQTISVSDFNNQDIELAFILPPDPGIGELAAAMPHTQFVAVGIPGLQAGANISLIGSSISRSDQAGFLAGIIAATTTNDFRVGVIYLADTALGKAARRGFSKGVSFYCGLCQPVNPPYPPAAYPLFYELPASAAQPDWDASIAYFKEWQAATIYVTPDLIDTGLDEYLAQAGFQIISHNLPSGSAKDRWTASIGAGDTIQAIRSHWQEFISVEGGLSFESPVGIAYINESQISPGKQHFIDSILSDLLDGYIDTGVDPATGEWR